MAIEEVSGGKNRRERIGSAIRWGGANRGWAYTLRNGTEEELFREMLIPHNVFLQLLALILSTLLDSGHFSSNQSSMSPLPLASSRFSLVVLAFFLPLSSRSRASLKTLSSSLFSKCPYLLTPLAFANQSIVSINPNMSICSSVVCVNNFLTTRGSHHSSFHSP